jgi:hypothetical protein
VLGNVCPHARVIVGTGRVNALAVILAHVEANRLVKL